jgi:hypothetical protein
VYGWVLFSSPPVWKVKTTVAVRLPPTLIEPIFTALPDCAVRATQTCPVVNPTHATRVAVLLRERVQRERQKIIRELIITAPPT